MSDLGKQTQSIEFLSDGLKIRGTLRLPPGNGPHPIVILGHGFGGLKEWTLPEVAEAFLDVGIAGLWFDFRNFGDSEGEPREEVAHYGRLEDWQNAIAYTAGLPQIDPERIGIWGTSLGGRDVLAVASINHRVKAVVAQTPLIKWTPQAAARMSGFGDNLDRYHQELAEDRRNRASGKHPRYLPFVKDSGDDAKREYVESRSVVELRNYKPNITLQSYQATALIDVTPLIGMISPIPLLFILAENDFLPGQRDAFDAAQEPKSLVTIGGHHFSPYTTTKNEAINASKTWFVKYLVAK